MSARTANIVGGLIGLCGFALFFWQTNWIAALGLFLAMAGNNLQQMIVNTRGSQ